MVTEETIWRVVDSCRSRGAEVFMAELEAQFQAAKAVLLETSLDSKLNL